MTIAPSLPPEAEQRCEQGMTFFNHVHSHAGRCRLFASMLLQMRLSCVVCAASASCDLHVWDGPPPMAAATNATAAAAAPTAIATMTPGARPPLPPLFPLSGASVLCMHPTASLLYRNPAKYPANRC